jgi:hypothetical protein
MPKQTSLTPSSKTHLAKMLFLYTEVYAYLARTSVIFNTTHTPYVFVSSYEKTETLNISVRKNLENLTV